MYLYYCCWSYIVLDSFIPFKQWQKTVVYLHDAIANYHFVLISVINFMTYTLFMMSYVFIMSHQGISYCYLPLPCISGLISRLLENRTCLMWTPVDDVSFRQVLLYLIPFQDPSHSLHEMVVKCIKATEQLDERVLDTLTKEVKDTFVQVNNSSMKEVKGIEDRLYGLDQILNSGRRVVQEQSDMAQVSNLVLFSSINCYWHMLTILTVISS